MRFLFFKKEKELPQSIKEATAKEVKKPLKETILFSIKGTFALFFKKFNIKILSNCPLITTSPYL